MHVLVFWTWGGSLLMWTEQQWTQLIPKWFIPWNKICTVRGIYTSMYKRGSNKRMSNPHKMNKRDDINAQDSFFYRGLLKHNILALLVTGSWSRISQEELPILGLLHACWTSTENPWGWGFRGTGSGRGGISPFSTNTHPCHCSYPRSRVQPVCGPVVYVLCIRMCSEQN
jgi:hypothetical protein